MTAAVGSLSIRTAKDNFFDAPLVLRRADAARKRNLTRLGAFVRTKAITLLLRHYVGRNFGAHSRVRDKHKGESAPPGQPPYAHLGDIAKFLFFGWDAPTKTVVVGPALLNKAAPALKELEEGGAATIAVSRGGSRNRHVRPAAGDELGDPGRDR